jgi:hypothetical protein
MRSGEGFDVARPAECDLEVAVASDNFRPARRLLADRLAELRHVAACHLNGSAEAGETIPRTRKLALRRSWVIRGPMTP